MPFLSFFEGLFMKRSRMKKWLLGSLVACGLAAGTSSSAMAAGGTLADSLGDFGGVQGGSNWLYGQYNRTADGNGIYEIGDFQDFPNDGGAFGPTNFFTGNTGGAYGFYDDPISNPPWTELGNNFSHPNTGGSENWTMRRYVAETSGNISLNWFLRKSNVNCGDGVAGSVYLNGVQIDTASIAFNDSAGVNKTLNLNISAGDILDFSLAPLANDGCDGCTLGANIKLNNVVQIANSITEFSGTQGQNNWTHGWYNKTGDGDASYAAGDFTAFTAGEFNGTNFALAGPPPWTTLGAADAHPNGINSSPNQEHWVVRRYEAEVAGDLLVEWNLRKTNPFGEGVSGGVYVNGVLYDEASVHGGDTTGRTRGIVVPGVNVGDKIDIFLSPVGNDGNPSDGADGSAFSANIFRILPPVPPLPTVKVADSVAEFSGSQGQDNWIYGYWDKRNDADHIYDPNEMSFFDDGFFQGGVWDLAVNVAPWTLLDANGGHPAANGQGDPEVHWAVRRWVSEVSGDIEIMGDAIHPSTGGDGTIVRIFIDGVEVYNASLLGSSVSFDFLASVNAGSYVDFVIDAGLADNDGADSTVLRAMIFQVIPEPTSALAMLGLASAALLRRRRD